MSFETLEPTLEPKPNLDLQEIPLDERDIPFSGKAEVKPMTREMAKSVLQSLDSLPVSEVRIDGGQVSQPQEEEEGITFFHTDKNTDTVSGKGRAKESPNKQEERGVMTAGRFVAHKETQESRRGHEVEQQENVESGPVYAAVLPGGHSAWFRLKPIAGGKELALLWSDDASYDFETKIISDETTEQEFDTILQENRLVYVEVNPNISEKHRIQIANALANLIEKENRLTIEMQKQQEELQSWELQSWELFRKVKSFFIGREDTPQITDLGALREEAAEARRIYADMCREANEAGAETANQNEAGAVIVPLSAEKPLASTPVLQALSTDPKSRIASVPVVSEAANDETISQPKEEALIQSEGNVISLEQVKKRRKPKKKTVSVQPAKNTAVPEEKRVESPVFGAEAKEAYASIVMEITAGKRDIVEALMGIRMMRLTEVEDFPEVLKENIMHLKEKARKMGLTIEDSITVDGFLRAVALEYVSRKKNREEQMESVLASNDDKDAPDLIKEAA